MKLYFARPENVAEANIDKAYKSAIRGCDHFRNHEIVAPRLSHNRHDFMDIEHVATLHALVSECHILIFLSFPDGMIHYRHAEKIQAIQHRRGVIYEMDVDGHLRMFPFRVSLSRRYLDHRATRDRIWDVGGRYMLPFN